MNSAAESTRSCSQLTQSEFDLLVIGGGIVGAGVARDAAMRVALVEQNDFASGTSSRSIEQHEQVAANVAQWMADICNWDADRADWQTADYYRAMNEAAPWRRSDDFKQRVEE